MKRFAVGLLCAIASYLIAAFVGYFLIDWLSPNTHDRSVEAAVTSAFVVGPLGAIVGFVLGVIRGGRSSGHTDTDRSGRR
jgi:phosphotransferase system  glucose/maltose/N-acetylglucosamine-specific IIC component